MLKARSTLGIFLVGLIVLGTGVVFGQTYPTKTIRVISPGVGSTSDLVGRYVAQGISAPLGQQVIVVNYSSGVITAQTVSKAPPDGYTLLVSGAALWIGPLLMAESPFDPVRDFSPITLVMTEPAVLVVHPSLPVKSVKELIALAKARPGELNYAASTAGSLSQMAGELFKFMANAKIEIIPYAIPSARTFDLLGGQTQLTIDSASNIMPYVKAGKVRALAVTSAAPTALVPGLPTVADSGVVGFEAVGRTGIFVPAKTPEAIIKRLNQEIVRFVKLPETKAQLHDIGQEAAGSSPEELAAIINSERERLARVIKAVGIRAQ